MSNINEFTTNVKTPSMLIRERIYDIEEDLKHLQGEPDCGQIAMVFNQCIGRKFETIKALP